MLTSSPPIGPISACHNSPVSGFTAQAVPVSVAVGEDLASCSNSTDERIIRRHRAVVAQPQGFPRMVIQLLRLHAEAVVFTPRATQAVPVANRHIEHPVGAEKKLSLPDSRLPGIGD